MFMENVEIKSAVRLGIFKISTPLVKTIALIWSTSNIGTQSIDSQQIRIFSQVLHQF